MLGFCCGPWVREARRGLVRQTPHTPFRSSTLWAHREGQLLLLLGIKAPQIIHLRTQPPPAPPPHWEASPLNMCFSSGHTVPGTCLHQGPAPLATGPQLGCELPSLLSSVHTVPALSSHPPGSQGWAWHRDAQGILDLNQTDDRQDS